MLFKNPGLLWFLFLLVIPILVHLLQLQKWKVEYFTNVKLLQQLQLQSQKSSQLKKWLLLFSRLLLLTAIILAFTKPFFPSKLNKEQAGTLVFILDNSYSLEAKGKEGVLLKRIGQSLLEEVPENTNFHLFTINENFVNQDIQSMTSVLQKLTYTPSPFDLELILNKIRNQFPQEALEIVVLTDGKGKNPNWGNLKKDQLVRWHYLPLVSEQLYNVSIDSVYLTNNSEQFHQIAVKVSTFGNYNQPISFGVYDQGQLLAKSMQKIGKENILTFNLPKQNIHGYVAIEDNSLPHDNQYFFTIANPAKPVVSVIGSPEKTGYLKRIFSPTEFVFQTFSSLEENIWGNTEILILNETESISESWSIRLQSFVDQGGTLVIIPKEYHSIKTLNLLTGNFGIRWNNFQEKEQWITKISFSHPLYKGVFTEEIQNFAYPKTVGNFGLQSNAASVLSYADGSPFLVAANVSQGLVFVFAAPLSEKWSTFKQTPLVVPSLYNMALQNKTIGMQTAWLLQSQSISLEANVNKEEVLTLKGPAGSVVPMQQIGNQKVRLRLEEEPTIPGNYDLVDKNNKVVQQLSLNIPRTESDITQTSWIENAEGEVITSVEKFLFDLKSKQTETNLWKAFVSLALLFLVLETLIQKYLR
jgi:hypothetical protein